MIFLFTKLLSAFVLTVVKIYHHIVKLNMTQPDGLAF